MGAGRSWASGVGNFIVVICCCPCPCCCYSAPICLQSSFPLRVLPYLPHHLHHIPHIICYLCLLTDTHDHCCICYLLFIYCPSFIIPLCCIYFIPIPLSEQMGVHSFLFLVVDYQWVVLLFRCYCCCCLGGDVVVVDIIDDLSPHCCCCYLVFVVVITYRPTHICCALLVGVIASYLHLPIVDWIFCAFSHARTGGWIVLRLRSFVGSLVWFVHVSAFCARALFHCVRLHFHVHSRRLSSPLVCTHFCVLYCTPHAHHASHFVPPHTSSLSLFSFLHFCVCFTFCAHFCALHHAHRLRTAAFTHVCLVRLRVLHTLHTARWSIHLRIILRFYRCILPFFSLLFLHFTSLSASFCSFCVAFYAHRLRSCVSFYVPLTPRFVLLFVRYTAFTFLCTHILRTPFTHTHTSFHCILHLSSSCTFAARLLRRSFTHTLRYVFTARLRHSLGGGWLLRSHPLCWFSFVVFIYLLIGHQLVSDKAFIINPLHSYLWPLLVGGRRVLTDDDR